MALNQVKDKTSNSNCWVNKKKIRKLIKNETTKN